jgi:hypothetical protein
VNFVIACSTNILVLTGQQHQYIGAIQGESKVGSTTPIRLNEAYSICWSAAETEIYVFKMAANFREKRTSITTMGVKTQAFASFPTPLVSHYSLPLNFQFLGWLFYFNIITIIWPLFLIQHLRSIGVRIQGFDDQNRTILQLKIFFYYFL